MATLTPQSETDGPQTPSAQLFRAASAALGHALFGEEEDGEAPTEATPLLRTRSRRQTMEEQVNQRTREEIQWVLSPDILFRGFCTVMVCFLVIIIAAMVAWLVLYAKAILAAVYYSDAPCDQPLKYYVLLTICWSLLGSHLNQLVMRCLQPRVTNHVTKLFVGLLLAIPGWLIVFWGVYMVWSSKTCYKTNPDLFYPTKYFIYMQVACHLSVLFMITIVILVLSLLSLRWLTTVLSRFRQQNPGCADAVRRLPKVAPDSQELIDPDDGSAMDCAICMDALVGSNSVVRCPCDHYFHQECLLEWCKSHLDCPLCRTQVGEPDHSEDSPV